MIPVIIGISVGLIVILAFAFLSQFDKSLVYGLILGGIGFLYVGFVWTDIQALIVNSVQAILFALIAYYGIKRNLYLLAAGYFLHGCWDIAYGLFKEPGLIPPHYDLFCSSLDFTICGYVIVGHKKFLPPTILS